MKAHVYTSDSPRRIRKQIIESLERQQGADSKAARQIRDRILVGSKNILGSLAKLLDSYSPEQSTSEVQKQIFQKISPNLSLADWLTIRSQYSECIKKLAVLKSRKKIAQENYGKDSPLGFISRWGKDDAGHRISIALMSENNRLADELSVAEDRKRSIELTIKSYGESFMRSSFEASSIEALCKYDSPIKSEVTNELGEMSHSVELLWREHAEQQVSSLSEVSQAAAALIEHYRKVTKHRL